MLFDLCLDGLSGEAARGMTQELQGGQVKSREAPLLEICAGQRLYALQPCGKRGCLRQRLHGIVGDNATFLRAPMVLEPVIAGAACQLRSWRRLHDQRPYIGRHPAGKEICVSGIWEEDELHSRRHP